MATVLPSRRRAVRGAAERGRPGPVLQVLVGHVRTVNLIHRAKRTRLRGYQGGGGWCRGVENARSRPWLWVLLWRWCVLEGGPRLPQPHLLNYFFLFCSGDAGSHTHWDPSHWDPSLLPSPQPWQLLRHLLTRLCHLTSNAGIPQGSVGGPPPVTHTRQCHARLWHHLWLTR